ncbi:MAG: patatin-like phospholipase family protein [Myxococcota bacterium]
MDSPIVGIVLSGGGARGAYEVGVLSGLCEALGHARGDPPPFRVVAGTSVGAINGAWVVANANCGDHGIEGLADVWRGLSLKDHLRVDLLGLLGWTSPLRFLRKPRRGDLAERFGRSVLDPTALEKLVERVIDWRSLHANIDAGVVRAFVVAALHIGTGVTTLFTEMAPGVSFHPSRHPRRVAKRGRIQAEHVLASAAIPALFPARRIGLSYFVDGGLRFNTPIAPAIRAGADKLVVVSLRPQAEGPPDVDTAGVSESYPSPVFLAGKLLNALLLDPVEYDLQVLHGFNRVMDVLDATLAGPDRARFDAALVKERGMSYRNIDTLVFEPSRSISVMAGVHLRDHGGQWQVGRFYDWLLSRAALTEATWEADLASYLMFDGSWAERLIELGRDDALARRDEIRAFFGK